MTRQDLRREPRVDIDLDVHLQTPDGERHYFAADASYRGIFLITSDPIPLRRMVRMRADLDDGHDAPLEMAGIVAHHLSSNDAQQLDHQPGMGIHLFSVGEPPRQRWQAFLERYYEADPSTRKAHRRLQMPHLVVHLSSPDELDDSFDAEARELSLFVPNNRVPSQGTEVLCNFVASDDGPTLTLEGTVEKAVQTPPRDRGVQLRFADLDDDDLRHIETFMAGEADPDSDTTNRSSLADEIPDIPADATG